MYLREECKCELGAMWLRLWEISRVRTRDGQPLQLENNVDLIMMANVLVLHCFVLTRIANVLKRFRGLLRFVK